jgi:hypothetical protein
VFSGATLNLYTLIVNVIANFHAPLMKLIYKREFFATAMVLTSAAPEVVLNHNEKSEAVGILQICKGH